MLFRSEGFLRRDALSGVTVALVALPLAIAFGVSSGMGATAGLVSAIVAGFIAALAGGSRYQVSGPTGAMTVVLLPIVHRVGVTAVFAAGLLAGLLLIAAGYFGLGSHIHRLPMSLIEGFTAGIAASASCAALAIALPAFAQPPPAFHCRGFMP